MMKISRLSAGVLLACLSLGGLTACNNGDGDSTVGGIVTPVPAAHIFGTGEAKLVNGDAATSRFNNPVNVAVADDGTVFVADFDNNAVRKISPTGQVSTLIQQANFERPFGLAISINGKQLYIQTDRNVAGADGAAPGAIWRISLTAAAPVPEVVVQNIGAARGLLALPNGNLILSDKNRHILSTLNPTTKEVTLLAGKAGEAGFVNNTGDAARFNRPYGLAFSNDGALLVADQGNNSIRRVTFTGAVTTFAGLGPTQATAVNGNISNATFNGPQDVATFGTKVYVADTGNHVIRKISDNTVSTVAGNGTRGFIDAPGTGAAFYGLEGVALTEDGKNLWIADGTGGDDNPVPAFHRVRYIPTP